MLCKYNTTTAMQRRLITTVMIRKQHFGLLIRKQALSHQQFTQLEYVPIDCNLFVGIANFRGQCFAMHFVFQFIVRYPKSPPKFFASEKDNFQITHKAAFMKQSKFKDNSGNTTFCQNIGIRKIDKDSRKMQLCTLTTSTSILTVGRSKHIHEA